MSLDRGGRTSIKSSFEVIMYNKEKLEKMQRDHESARKRLNGAIDDLEELGIKIKTEIADQLYKEDSLFYSERLRKALEKYINAKNEGFVK